MILVALFYLLGRLPSHQAAGYGAGLYLEGTAPVTLDSVRVGYLEQSPTWVAHGDDPAWWAFVPLEAAPRVVWAKSIPWTLAGDTLRVWLPDTFAVKRWWWMEGHNWRGWAVIGETVWH